MATKRSKITVHLFVPHKCNTSVGKEVPCFVSKTSSRGQQTRKTVQWFFDLPQISIVALQISGVTTTELAVTTPGPLRQEISRFVLSWQTQGSQTSIWWMCGNTSITTKWKYTHKHRSPGRTAVLQRQRWQDKRHSSVLSNKTAFVVYNSRDPVQNELRSTGLPRILSVCEFFHVEIWINVTLTVKVEQTQDSTTVLRILPSLALALKTSERKITQISTI